MADVSNFLEKFVIKPWGVLRESVAEESKRADILK